MLTDDQREDLAARLRRAERERAPIPPLTDSQPLLTAEDAYEIQLGNIRRRLPGTEVVGHKVGLSSPVMQAMMGVDEPDYGHLLADMRLDPDVPVAVRRYCFPRVEVEVGFLLGVDLPGHGCTERDVLAGTAALVPAIELIDSRIADWRIRLADTIADNASSAGFVLGEQRIPPDSVDPRAIDAVLHRDGERIAEGRSDAVLGDPVRAVAWLARKVAGFGVRLRAGHVVLPGSCTRAVNVGAGAAFAAEFSTGGRRLGAASVTFR
ncbi:2-keto-4-pentenoate hydratase [Saccharopolyspora sp. 6M]|uniref:2-keto-4-pentenoate hydratase n=1 Tax=Saccharopolyspora sp. 6M TaxID=2877237 RepID=UPI001CD650FD|nr:fumarylacetoacetate hydrolase family protein [Saccharopolyspora sp. 6M]MCA1227627.1 fumarylacetoacetate hydrolase family protein [Saccharopolyspora sp. 6M]